MGRLLVLLVVVGFGWWAYSAYTAKASHAELSDEFDPPPLQAGASGSVDEELAEEVVGGANVSSPEEDKIGIFVERLKAGDARSRAAVFAVYAKTERASDRRRIGEAVASILESVEVDEAVALLGPRNAFVHTDLGRGAMRKVLRSVVELEPREALKLSTKLLESSLNGRIAVGDDPARKAVEAAYAEHLSLVRRVTFDPANAARARRYEVQSGDSLDAIARRFRKSGLKVESGTLALVNRIDNPNALRVGQRLRVPIDPVRCVARKKSFSLAVYVGDELVRHYWMAHGKKGHETPETTFVVGEKIPNPDWPSPDGELIPFGDARNPLGRFFVKFMHDSYSGFGAHGTNEPESIGTRASLGCLRLLPDDIAEFTRFVPRGAEVKIL